MIIDGASGSSLLPGLDQGGSSEPTPPGGQLGKNEFLKLLVAQMRNQDPMNPKKSQELAVQLAQFSSVEQLISLNDKLSGRSGLSARGVGADLLGKEVVAEGNRFRLPESGGASVRFRMESQGQAVLKVLDGAGRVVGERELGALGEGRHTVDVGAAADSLEAGTYRFRIDATGPEGESVDTRTLTGGTVDGVRFEKDGPVLQIGELTVPLSDVLEVTTPDSTA